MFESSSFGSLYDEILFLLEFRGYDHEDEFVFKRNNERIEFKNRLQVIDFALNKSINFN